MPTFTAKGDLLFQDGSTPKRYYAIGSFYETQDYSLISVSQVQTHPSESDGFVIQYTVGDNSRGGDQLEADLGTIALVANTGFIDLEYYDEERNYLGKKRIRTEEAQKDTRPTK